MSKSRKYWKHRTQSKKSRSRFGLLFSVTFGAATAAAIAAVVLHFFMGVNVRAELINLANTYLQKSKDALAQQQDSHLEHDQRPRGGPISAKPIDEPSIVNPREPEPRPKDQVRSPSIRGDSDKKPGDDPPDTLKQPTSDDDSNSDNTSAPKNGQSPAPSKGVYSELEKLYSRQYQSRYKAALNSSEKLRIGIEIHDQANAFKQDKDAKYVGLNLTRHIAIDIADITLAEQVIFEMASNYALDAFRLRLHTYQNISKNMHDTEKKRVLMRHVLALLDDLQVVDDLPLEDSFLQLEDSVLQLVKDIDTQVTDSILRDRVNKKLKADALRKKDRELFKSALEKIKNDPEKHKAELIIGLYKACYTESGIDGLKLISMLLNNELATEAQKELAKEAQKIVDPSTLDPARRLILTGMSWLKIADHPQFGLSRLAVARMKMRAGECFRKTIESESEYATMAAKEMVDIFTAATEFDLDVTTILMPQHSIWKDTQKLDEYLDRMFSRKQASIPIKAQMVAAIQQKTAIMRMYPIVNWRSDGIGYNNPANYFYLPVGQVFLDPIPEPR